ncbi:MAG: 2-dehydropantoate 2-reductase [Chloroflexi bacterium]|nr:2-dehydropantoate 2-reductase [Chloroflexota bacterium]
MRIAIVGAGGVGAYLGVLLAGYAHDITLVDRGEHLDALRHEGVTIRSRVRGELHARLPATDAPSDVGPVDLVLYCVKTYDNATAIPSLRPLVGLRTAILTLQNGVGNVERLAAAYSPARVLGGALVGGGTRVAPGVVEHVLPPEAETIDLGALEPGSAERAEQARAVLAPTGLTVTVVPDIQRTLWIKLLGMASLSALGCLTRRGTADWREHPATRTLYERFVREAAVVGIAEGLDLDEATVASALAQPDRLGPAHRTSLHADLERGARLEVEAIHGEVVRRAERHGIPTPSFETAYAVLQLADQRAASHQ